jgi:diguanylate cyclase (GGDEF)-like protein
MGAAARAAAPIPRKAAEALETLGREIARLRQEARADRRKIAKLERLADEDALIGLQNRRAFIRDLERVILHTRRLSNGGGQPSAVVYIDLDGLKAINDEFGHNAGDAALKHVGSRLRSLLRQSDVVARLGGDEFGLLMFHTELGNAREKAGWVAGMLADDPLVWHGHRIRMSISWGAAPVTGDEDETPEGVLKKADDAMYAARQAARSRRRPGRRPPRARTRR